MAVTEQAEYRRHGVSGCLACRTPVANVNPPQLRTMNQASLSNATTGYRMVKVVIVSSLQQAENPLLTERASSGRAIHHAGDHARPAPPLCARGAADVCVTRNRVLADLCHSAFSSYSKPYGCMSMFTSVLRDCTLESCISLSLQLLPQGCVATGGSLKPWQDEFREAPDTQPAMLQEVDVFQACSRECAMNVR